jgi:hypothetical protein
MPVDTVTRLNLGVGRKYACENVFQLASLTPKLTLLPTRQLGIRGMHILSRIAGTQPHCTSQDLLGSSRRPAYAGSSRRGQLLHYIASIISQFTISI